MLRTVVALWAVVLSVLSISSAQANDDSIAKESFSVKIGDLIVQRDRNGWSAINILAVDSRPDGSATAHCLAFKSIASKPTIESLRGAAVLAWHAPIDAGSFSQGWEKIGNQTPSKEELAGFIEYLKLTDFPRYIAITGQDSDEVVLKANEH